MILDPHLAVAPCGGDLASDGRNLDSAVPPFPRRHPQGGPPVHRLGPELFPPWLMPASARQSAERRGVVPSPVPSTVRGNRRRLAKLDLVEVDRRTPGGGHRPDRHGAFGYSPAGAPDGSARPRPCRLLRRAAENRIKEADEDREVPAPTCELPVPVRMNLWNPFLGFLGRFFRFPFLVV